MIEPAGRPTVVTCSTVHPDEGEARLAPAKDRRCAVDHRTIVRYRGRMSEGSAGLYVTVDSEDGRQLGAPFTHRVQAEVGTGADHYLTVTVLDTGDWVLTEVDLAR